MPSAGSGDLSNGLLRNILDLLKLTNAEELAIKYHTPFRKLAHFSEYFILGMLIYSNISEYSKKKYILVITIALCTLYATTDEVHQLFVEGRFCSFIDVLIDTAGASVGAFIIHLKKLVCYQEKKH